MVDISRAILEAEAKAEGPDVGGGPLKGRRMRFREHAEVLKFVKPPKELDEIEEAVEHAVEVEKGSEVEILEIFTADLVLTSLPLGEGCALVEWTALEEVR